MRCLLIYHRSTGCYIKVHCLLPSDSPLNRLVWQHVLFILFACFCLHRQVCILEMHWLFAWPISFTSVLPELKSCPGCAELLMTSLSWCLNESFDPLLWSFSLTALHIYRSRKSTKQDAPVSSLWNELPFCDEKCFLSLCLLPWHLVDSVWWFGKPVESKLFLLHRV